MNNGTHTHAHTIQRICRMCNLNGTKLQTTKRQSYCLNSSDEPCESGRGEERREEVKVDTHMEFAEISFRCSLSFFLTSVICVCAFFKDANKNGLIYVCKKSHYLNFPL